MRRQWSSRFHCANINSSIADDKSQYRCSYRHRLLFLLWLPRSQSRRQRQLAHPVAARLSFLAALRLRIAGSHPQLCRGNRHAADDAGQAISVVSSGDITQEMNAKVTEAENATLADSLNRLPVDVGLYADAEHNLQRLVRKAGVPARTEFRIINTNTGEIFSQWINNAQKFSQLDTVLAGKFLEAEHLLSSSRIHYHAIMDTY